MLSRVPFHTEEPCTYVSRESVPRLLTAHAVHRVADDCAVRAKSKALWNTGETLLHSQDPDTTRLSVAGITLMVERSAAAEVSGDVADATGADPGLAAKLHSSAFLFNSVAYY